MDLKGLFATELMNEKLTAREQMESLLAERQDDKDELTDADKAEYEKLSARVDELTDIINDIFKD